MKALTSITTMQDLADAAGVSLATVSRVFSGSNKVSEKTKEKVMELVKQSGFYPNETARTMAAGKSRLI
ncbi:MAG: LacI family DNA-binding transcriptional regulator, partial [Treponema sp.]|nr:LacI family DNA-binding transcriptional regulator [Treponema sp.]